MAQESTSNATSSATNSEDQPTTPTSCGGTAANQNATSVAIAARACAENQRAACTFLACVQAPYYHSATGRCCTFTRRETNRTSRFTRRAAGSSDDITTHSARAAPNAYYERATAAACRRA